MAVAQPHPTSNLPDAASFDSVQADAVAEMLDEQERADRDHFRGLRRRLANPPSLQEMGKFMLDHKMATVVGVLSLFFVAEYLRSGQLLYAAVFGIMATGLIYMGTHDQFASGTLFQASAFCYLIVLIAFPIVLKNREQLELVGIKMLENPRQVAQQPNVARPSLPVAPEPGADDGQMESPDGGTPAADPGTSAEPPPVGAQNHAEPGIQPDAAPSAPGTPDNSPSVTPPAPVERPEPMPDTVPSPAPSLVVPAESSPSAPVDFAKPEALREQADKAFSEADTAGGMQYLYADAIAHPDSDVWNAFRWNRALGRPVIGVRWCAATALDDLASQLTKITIGDHPVPLKGMAEFQKTAATAFARQTQTMGGDVAVRWFRQCFDDGKFGDPELIRAPSERALRGATYLGADTPAEVQRAARAQQLDFLLMFDLHGVQATGSRAAVSATIRVIDVAGRRELHASKPRTQPAQVRRDVENTLEAMTKEGSLEPLPDDLDTAAIETRLKSLSGRKVDNPLPLVAELGWYAREKRLPQAKIEQTMAALIGPEAAKILSAGSDAERVLLLCKWLPKQKQGL